MFSGKIHRVYVVEKEREEKNSKHKNEKKQHTRRGILQLTSFLQTV